MFFLSFIVKNKGDKRSKYFVDILSALHCVVICCNFSFLNNEFRVCLSVILSGTYMCTFVYITENEN